MFSGMIKGLSKKQEKGKRRRLNTGWSRIGLVIMAAFVLCAAFILAGVLAGQNSPQPRRAPVNPEFTKYLDDVRNRRVPLETAEGYGLGEIPPIVDLSYMTGAKIFPAVEALPLSYDLRTLSKVTGVRNQGNCGSCWAFATYASLESYLLPAETWDFSEENLNDHHGFDWLPCNGGNYLISTAYLARWSGPLNEAEDPYVHASEGATGPQKHVQNIIFLPNRSGFLDNDNIKQAVMTYGAVYVSMSWNASYYNASQYTYYCPGAAPVNHGVAVVGWDDNFDRNKFSTIPPGDGAFIIKNSWGPAWGQSGYFYISYYDVPFRPGGAFTGEPITNYSGVYQYDPLGFVARWEYTGSGIDSTVGWGANIFTATSSNPLKAVSTYNMGTTLNYTVKIYTNVTAGNPVSGNLMATKTGTLAAPGYYTIPLSSAVPLTSGQQFSVVVRYQTPGVGGPMPTEIISTGYSSGATSSPGQSFMSYDGVSWWDLSAEAALKGNFCIKAFTGTPSIQPVISGKVRTPDGTGIAGVTLSGLPANPVTPASGAYSDTVPGGWSGTVTPTGGSYTFSPSSRSYTSVIANQFDQDYTASTSGCSYVVSPQSHIFPASGGNAGETVTAGAACAWTAASNVPWVTITSGTPGSGSGVAMFTVDANPGPSRTGTLVVAGRTVTIIQDGNDPFNSPAGYIVLPECIWAPATGGGTWVSEVQVTDVTGGSMVSAYFCSGGGIRKGPITIWNNTDGARRSVKFSNLLSFFASKDPGFTYYGSVGAVEFLTQDNDHRIQVGARTINGNCSKTFPGLAPSDANMAVVSRPMMIQNFTNTSLYRSTCGFFNTSSASLTVEFRLYAATGAMIGSAFTKTFVGHDFKAFSPFTEAGVPYPTYSYDNTYLLVTPTSGLGSLICFGASANNLSNDPAAHIAVQYQGAYDNSPANAVILPECIWAPATGGGTWVSEVQVTDLTGGSVVSAYFSSGGGSRRGPVTVWTNAGGAGRSAKFSNFLSSMGAADSGFIYYGKVGTVEFVTQDAAHKIQVAARTLNGNYAKTFPGLCAVGSNTADTTREVIIQNYTNNVTYRSTCGFFNPTADSVTVEFRLYNSEGVTIGSAFTKTFVGYDFKAFSPFNEAGVPYPGASYDNVVLSVKPTSGTGKLVCFGASANNASNDPAAHIALQYN